jgi:hypothetical protein
MNTTTTGVWLIGVGSLIIFAGLIFGSESASIGLTFAGAFNNRFERVRFAVECVGAGMAAFGSVLLAAENPPSAWLMLTLVPAYLVLHVLTAWKLRQYWLKRRTQNPDGSQANDESLKLQQNACLEVCSTWAWCLRHPFNDETWPESATERYSTIQAQDRPRSTDS